MLVQEEQITSARKSTGQKSQGSASSLDGLIEYGTVSKGEQSQAQRGLR